MLNFKAPAKINGRELEKEIAAATGIPPGRVWVTQVGGDITVEGVETAQEASVRSVIAAHTGEPTPEQKQDADLRVQLAAVLNELESAAVPDMWRTLRADVKDERVRQTVAAVAALIRIRLQKYG